MDDHKTIFTQRDMLSRRGRRGTKRSRFSSTMPATTSTKETPVIRKAPARTTASACSWIQVGGIHFSYTTPQGSAGPNDSHGGTSFSLFVAADGKGNTYTSKINSPAIRLNGEYGFFADLPTTIENELKTKSWQKLARK